jgi:chromosomal replication initiator protein
MQEKYEVIWGKCLEIIKNNVSTQVFSTWFEPIKPVDLKNVTLTIQVPSQFFYEWLEEHYVNIIKKSLIRELGEKAKLEYRIIVEKSGGNISTINYPNNKTHEIKNNENFMPITIGNQIKNPFVIPGIKKVSIDSQLNPLYTFDNFIEGDCNRLARAAGFAVAQKPGGTAFNPLVLYGNSGNGKTHLLQAIGNYIKSVTPNKTVLYVSCDKFLNQLGEAFKNNSILELTHFYQLIDVLLVDDIFWLDKKYAMQDVFFSIFNHLHNNGKQIVITSDRAPKDLEGIEERLLSRLKWGLMTEMTMPDYETRMTILEKKMHADGVELPREVVEYVAYNINTNIRDLEGAMIALLAQASLIKKEIDVDLAKKIIKNFIKSVSREVSVEYIQKTVCDFVGINSEAIKQNTRKCEVRSARQIAMYLAKKYTKNSLKEIGKHFGGKDHSTVIHSIKVVENQLEVDKKFKDDIDELKKRIYLSNL